MKRSIIANIVLSNIGKASAGWRVNQNSLEKLIELKRRFNWRRAESTLMTLDNNGIL